MYGLVLSNSNFTELSIILSSMPDFLTEHINIISSKLTWVLDIYNVSIAFENNLLPKGQKLSDIAIGRHKAH